MLIIKVILFIFLSFVSSIATFSYGFRFATDCLFTTPSTCAVSFGFLFALFAGLCNIILGTYSLLKINLSQFNHQTYLLGLSLMGSIPIGFICFFGCKNTLPFAVNLLISMVVTFVNSGIYFTSINNLIKTFSKTLHQTKPLTLDPLHSAIRFAGISIGLIVSIIGFLAATHGIDIILNYYGFKVFNHYHLSYLIATFAWIPYAALFINGNYLVANELYVEYQHFFVSRLKLRTLLVFLFFIFSGSALAEITYEIWNETFSFPQTGFLLYVGDYILVPLALFSSAALNYFSIKGLLQIVRKKFTKSDPSVFHPSQASK